MRLISKIIRFKPRQVVREDDTPEASTQVLLFYLILLLRRFPQWVPSSQLFFSQYPNIPITISQITAHHLLLDLLLPLTRWSSSSSFFWGDLTPNPLKPLVWVHPTEMPAPSQLSFCYFFDLSFFLCPFLLKSLHF